MANLEFRKFLNFLGFIATIIIAATLLISFIVSLFQESKGIPLFQVKDIISALTMVATVIAFFVTIVGGFMYARSKRNVWFMLAQTGSTIIILASIIVGALVK